MHIYLSVYINIICHLQAAYHHQLQQQQLLLQQQLHQQLQESNKVFNFAFLRFFCLNFFFFCCCSSSRYIISVLHQQQQHHNYNNNYNYHLLSSPRVWPQITINDYKSIKLHQKKKSKLNLQNSAELRFILHLQCNNTSTAEAN